MKSLESKVAVIVGAGRGIGAATAKLLAAEGANVAVVDIRPEMAEATAAAIRASGGDAIGIAADVGSEADMLRMVDKAVTEFGRIDILHNNAAPTQLLAHDGGVVEIDLEIWEGTFAGITRGTFLACKHVIPHMQRTGGGSIINTSSMAAQRGVWVFHAYGAAKAGVDNLTRCIATRYGKDGIRCNSVAPGFITHPAEGETEVDLDPEFKAQWLEVILGNRVGIDRDIARTVLFLAQDAAEYITGQIIAIDGGVLAWGPWGRVGSGGSPVRKAATEAGVVA